MFEGLGAMLANGASKAGGFIENNPEKFAIAADMIGKNLAPNNPAAGVGTLFGQSSLANKAAGEAKKERQAMMSLLTSMLGGQVPQTNAGGTQVSGVPTNNVPPFSLTPANLPGPTSVAFKAQPDGSIVSTTNASVTKPAQPGAGSANMTDLLPLLKALSGSPQVDMTGLNPEQILGFARNDLGLGSLGQQTVSQIMDKQAKDEANAVEWAKVDSYNSLNKANAIKANMETITKLQEEIRKGELHPTELAQKKADLKKTQADTNKLSLEVENEKSRQKLLSVLTPDTKLEDLNTASLVKVLGSSAAEKFISGQQTETRLTEEQKLKKRALYTEALARFNNNEATEADAVDINAFAPDTEKAVYYYDDGAGLFNTEGVKRVELSEGDTLADIRRIAAENNMSIQEVARKYKEAQKAVKK